MSLIGIAKATQIAAAASSIALARKRTEHVPAAVALVVLTVVSLARGPLNAALPPRVEPRQGAELVLIYLDGAAELACYATIALMRSEVDGRTVGAKLRTHTILEDTVLMTDDSQIYDRVGQNFMDHRSVNHSKEEYVRIDPDGVLVTTNTAEGLFANLRRQLDGTHHHTSHKHLPKYLEEFDFKYNNRGLSDVERTDVAIENIEGRRLTLYKSVDGGSSLFDRKPGELKPYYREP